MSKLIYFVMISTLVSCANNFNRPHYDAKDFQVRRDPKDNKFIESGGMKKSALQKTTVSQEKNNSFEKTGFSKGMLNINKPN